MSIRPRRRAAFLAVVGAVAAALVFGALPAAAAPPPSAAVAAGEGWLRLGHFSPDTAHVDIRVTALSGGSVVLALSDIGYGDISPYSPLAPGTYTIAMVGTGTTDWSKPVISEQVNLGSGTASTVAAYGLNQKLQVRAFSDDLTAPTAGTARVRVVQASSLPSRASIATSTGVSIAKSVAGGTSTPYTEVPAGSWTLELTSGSLGDDVDVDLAAGSVTSLFVLDTAARGVTLLAVLDSAASPATPVEGVQTGGGGTADRAVRLVDLLG